MIRVGMVVLLVATIAFAYLHAQSDDAWRVEMALHYAGRGKRYGHWW